MIKLLKNDSYKLQLEYTFKESFRIYTKRMILFLTVGILSFVLLSFMLFTSVTTLKESWPILVILSSIISGMIGYILVIHKIKYYDSITSLIQKPDVSQIMKISNIKFLDSKFIIPLLLILIPTIIIASISVVFWNANYTFFIPSQTVQISSHEIPKVDPNKLVEIIKQQQFNNVRESYGRWTHECFTDEDLNRFISEEKPFNIANQLIQNKEFLEVVLAIKGLQPSERQRLLENCLRISRPTFSELGRIGREGQTEAGQRAERMIARAIVDLVRELYVLPDSKIINLYKKEKEELQPPKERIKVAKLDTTVSESQGLVSVRKVIREYQTRFVQPGGTPEYGCYTWDDRKRFLSETGISGIVEQAKGNTEFMGGVIAIKSFSKKKLETYFEDWRKPVYPTWAMLGRISQEGTTDAGYQTQSDIAYALVDLVKELIKYKTDEIVKIWKSNSNP